MAIGLHDRALLAGCCDGHLRGALGTFRERHDLLAKLVIAGLRSQVSQRLPHIVLVAPSEGAKVAAPRGATAPRADGGDGVRIAAMTYLIGQERRF
jgi:hypothetical protein